MALSLTIIQNGIRWLNMRILFLVFLFNHAPIEYFGFGLGITLFEIFVSLFKES